MNKSNQPFKITLPKTKKVGVLISIPHCGVDFPDEIKCSYRNDMIAQPDDTDWCLNQLYDFAPDLGITTIQAVYSRWVIDLNRTPENKSLYSDGRIITSLCPRTDFFGEEIYTTIEKEPDHIEIKRRLKNYYMPYHQKIDAILQELKKEFEKVIFWDSHSIRRSVKTIQKEDFPDLILGNNDGLTADDDLIQVALDSLKKSGLELTHNHPFKGGFLTRSKGNPSKGINALQLEMSKDLYMSNNELNYDLLKAEKIKQHLIFTFNNLISFINE